MVKNLLFTLLIALLILLSTVRILGFIVLLKSIRQIVQKDFKNYLMKQEGIEMTGFLTCEEDTCDRKIRSTQINQVKQDFFLLCAA